MAQLNPRIINTIKDYKAEEPIKKFLIVLLEVEFANAGLRWNYSGLYDKYIETFSSEYNKDTK